MLCHVFENIIAEKLTAHLFKYNLLSTNRFGLMPNRSTCSQLLIALNKWFKNFDNDAVDIDIIYTDILKAFDTVVGFGPVGLPTYDRQRPCRQSTGRNTKSKTN